MKKYFSIASALMLALCMNSCSNDLDEVQAPAEQQAELHRLYLTATAPNSSETRAFISGTEDSDAITISGWKNGDVIYGIYQIETGDRGNHTGKPGTVKFTFNDSTKEFVSEETTVSKGEIKYFIHGGEIECIGGNNTFDYRENYGNQLYINAIFYFTEPFLTVDVENNFTNVPLYGEAGVSAEGKFTANMQMPSNLSFICLHNNTDSSIDVKMMMDTNYTKGAGFQLSTVGTYSFTYDVGTSDYAAVKTIPANGKAYLPIQCTAFTYKVLVNGIEIATKSGNNFTAGKVYKLNYPVN